MEAIVVLVPAPDFKSGGGRGDTSSAGSIPVRFRQTGFGFAAPRTRCTASNHLSHCFEPRSIAVPNQRRKPFTT